MLTYQKSFWIKVLIPAIIATLKMTILATAISTVLGLLLAVLLIMTNENGVAKNRYIHGFLNFVINLIRSFPFIILIIFNLPFTKLVMGTSIGVKGAMVPLIIAATAFIAKVVGNSLQEVDPDLIEAMRSFGLTERQVIFKVMFSEALPSMISDIILATIAVLGCTAMAGVVGAGGVGSVALIYGYQSFRKDVMYVTVFILFLIVQFIQTLGNYVYRRLK